MTVANFWKNGTGNMRLSTLRKLAEALGVTMDYLAYGTEPDTMSSIKAAYGTLSEEGRKRLLLYAQFLESEEKQ